MSSTEKSIQNDVRRISRIPFLPALLDLACMATGLGFAAVSRVTDERWIAAGVKDEISFGLEAGGELPVKTTLCHDILHSGKPVVIDYVCHDATYKDHSTPTIYGFQSYISYPIIRRDGVVFGTVCAIDPNAAQLKTPLIDRLFTALAAVVAEYLDSEDTLTSRKMAAVDLYSTAELKNLRHDIDLLGVGGWDNATGRSVMLLTLKLDLLIIALEPHGAFVA